MGRVGSNAVICFHSKKKKVNVFLHKQILYQGLDFLLIDRLHAADRLADVFYYFFCSQADCYKNKLHFILFFK